MAIKPVGSGSSEIPIIRASESILTAIVLIIKKTLKPIFSRNKLCEGLKALLKINKPFTRAPIINKYGCVLNKIEGYDSERGQTLAPGYLKFESKVSNLPKKSLKKMTPSRKEGLRNLFPINKKVS